jgi:hypothetical protein
MSILTQFRNVQARALRSNRSMGCLGVSLASTEKDSHHKCCGKERYQESLGLRYQTGMLITGHFHKRLREEQNCCCSVHDTIGLVLETSPKLLATTALC